MLSSNNFDVNGLTVRQYSQLMSPLRKERNKSGALTERNVTWIRHTFNHITTFFHRLFHAVFHKDHRWENDKTLLKKFTVGLEKIGELDQETLNVISLLGEELILRNPLENTGAINDKLTQLTRSTPVTRPTPGAESKPPRLMDRLRDLPRQRADLRGSQIGKLLTMSSKARRKLLTPTLDPVVLAKSQKEEETDSVKKRRKEIEDTKELYRPQVEEDEKENPERHRLIKKYVEEGQLIPTTRGVGGAYFLKYGGVTEYVVKPHGEGTHCPHNRKTDEETGELLCGTEISQRFRIRKSIPLHFEVLSEILYCRVAKLLGLQAYVPETFPVLIKSKEFFDRAEDPKNPQPKEKLCSAQQFTTNKGRVSDIDSEEKLKDIKSFSVGAHMLLGLLCGDTDDISQNCLVGEDNELISIDNGLSFPENNSEIRTCIVLLPQAEEQFDSFFVTLINQISDENDPLSKQLIDLIQTAQEQHAKVSPASPFARTANSYHKKVIKALRDRIEIMKWAIDKGMSMREVGLRVIALANGEEYARREEPITEKDVASFHFGGDNTIRWVDIRRKMTPDEESEDDSSERGLSSEGGATMVVHEDDSSERGLSSEGGGTMVVHEDDSSASSGTMVKGEGEPASDEPTFAGFNFD